MRKEKQFTDEELEQEPTENILMETEKNDEINPVNGMKDEDSSDC